MTSNYTIEMFSQIDYLIYLFQLRNALESNTLRFLAKIQTRDPIQADRRFIISYYLSDDSIYVFEPPVKNSGKFNSISEQFFFILFK